jgi:hypothetical protein
VSAAQSSAKRWMVAHKQNKCNAVVHAALLKYRSKVVLDHLNGYAQREAYLLVLHTLHQAGYDLLLLPCELSNNLFPDRVWALLSRLDCSKA